MKMDTVFPGNRCLNRAILNPIFHHGVYWIIILWEFLISTSLLWGAYRLFQALRSTAEVFQRSKSIATLGLTLAFALMLFGFLTIGGEWFFMWQSSQYQSGLDSASRVLIVLGITLLFLQSSDQGLSKL
jgi:predicted small integral membrane protein